MDRELFGTVIAAVCLVGLAVCLVVLFASAVLPPVMAALEKWKAAPRSKWLIVPFVVSCCYVGMTKHVIGHIEFPYTDVETRYLIDAGSYVTNDYVRVAFTRILVPETAPFFLDACLIGSTNVTADTFCVYQGTFAGFNNPTNFPYAAATNYNWFAYTTWTPGPSVRTNGVVDINWKRDNLGHDTIVPIRTGIYLNGSKISPPAIVIDVNLSATPGDPQNE